MSVPWYVSEEIKSMLKSADVEDINSVFSCFDETGMKTFADPKTGIPRVCGILVIKYSRYEVPVVIIEGQVYDIYHKIFNRQFESFYEYTGAIGVNGDRSKYILTQSMLLFFIKHKINFMRSGCDIKELKERRIVKWNSYNVARCWLMD